MVKVDSATGDIYLTHGGNNYLYNTHIFIEFYYTLSECNFITLYKIPLELEVCGGERVVI
jgi:hypothetical protein